MSKSYKPHQVKAVEIKLQKALITEHDLYNYETINFTSKKIITNNDILIGESQNEFILSDPANTFGTPVNPYIEIKKEGDSFYLKNKFTNPTYNQTPNKKYKIVRSAKLIDGFNPKGMPLKLGTIFKLGKSKFRVIEINKYKKNKKELEAKTLKSINEIEKNYNDSQMKDVTEQVKEVSRLRKANPKEEIICRYCFAEHVDPEIIKDDPFNDLMIHPCNCDGGSKYVHLHCLKTWLQNKVVSNQSSTVVNYKWDKLSCEVCKCEWPLKVKNRNEFRSLFSIFKPDLPYLIVEEYSDSNDMKNSLFLIVGNKDGKIKIGRGHLCDFQINEITVSRFHSFIEFQNNQFILKDNMSRYGTFIQMREDIKIDFERIAIQVNSTIFLISLINFKEEDINKDEVEERFN